MLHEDINKDKEMLHFSNYLAKSKHFNSSNKSLVDKMKDETGCVATEEFI